jgi:hypothetical protein
MLRGLIEAIVLTPEKGQLRIELRGNLAAMLTAAQQTKRSPETGDLLVPVQLVAGACNHRCLQRWSGAGVRTFIRTHAVTPQHRRSAPSRPSATLQGGELPLAENPAAAGSLQFGMAAVNDRGRVHVRKPSA